MERRARFDHIARNQDELDISKGDIITNVRRVNAGWLRGTLADKVGDFPDHAVQINTASISAEEYLDLLQENTEELTVEPGCTNGTPVGSTGWFPAQFVKIYNSQELESAKLLKKIKFKVHTDYSARNTAELTLNKGDILTRAEYVKAGWYQGVLTRKCVKLPSSHLKLNTADLSKKLLKMMEFVVTQDFTATRSEELTICRGDIILHVGEAKDGWLKGELRGEMGLFPDNCVMLANAPKWALPDLEFIVTADYKQTGHIKIKEGTTMYNPKLVDNEWYSGTLVSRPGLFPDNVVEINSTILSAMWQKYCIAFIVICDYTAKGPKQLTIRKGDIITQVRGKSYGWCKGMKVGQTAIMQNSLVKLNSNGIWPRTLTLSVTSNYTATNANQLTIREGDVIRNVHRAEGDWLHGTLIGRTGLFPHNLVEVISESDDDTIESGSDVSENDSNMELGPDATENEDDMESETDVSDNEGALESEPKVNRKAGNVKPVKSVLDILGLLKCLNCLEIPDHKIYQCVNGHVVCRRCVQEIEKCAECNVYFKVKGKFIKSRVAAALALSFNSLPE